MNKKYEFNFLYIWLYKDNTIGRTFLKFKI